MLTLLSEGAAPKPAVKLPPPAALPGPVSAVAAPTPAPLPAVASVKAEVNDDREFGEMYNAIKEGSPTCAEAIEAARLLVRNGVVTTAKDFNMRIGTHIRLTCVVVVGGDELEAREKHAVNMRLDRLFKRLFNADNASRSAGGVGAAASVRPAVEGASVAAVVPPAVEGAGAPDNTALRPRPCVPYPHVAGPASLSPVSSLSMNGAAEATSVGSPGNKAPAIVLRQRSGQGMDSGSASSTLQEPVPQRKDVNTSDPASWGADLPVNTAFEALVALRPEP